MTDLLELEEYIKTEQVNEKMETSKGETFQGRPETIYISSLIFLL